jgi:hypothetical protein
MATAKNPMNIDERMTQQAIQDRHDAQVILASVYYQPTLITTLRELGLETSDFYNGNLGALYGEILSCFDDDREMYERRPDKPLNAIEMRARLKMFPTAQSLMDEVILTAGEYAVESARRLADHVSRLRQSSARRRLIELGGAITAAALDDRLDRARELAERATIERTEPRPSPADVQLVPYQTISAAALKQVAFRPMRWIIDDILPEGTILLAGKPKTKKSWLALQFGVAIASGGKVLGHYDVVKSRVLYLDLESNQRRMQSRLRAMDAFPENLEIATEWRPGQEGLDDLRAYLTANTDTGLVVIDILARFRPPYDKTQDPYSQDYTFLQQINRLSEEFRVSIVVIHHTRKSKADSAFDEISGTTGLTGAVAGSMVLANNSEVPGEQLLHIQGRDITVDDTLAVKWEPEWCMHVYVARGAEASSSAERRRVYEAFIDDNTEMSLKELAAAVGKTVKAVDNHLRRLMDDNLVGRTSRGRYQRIPQVREQPAPAPAGAVYRAPEPPSPDDLELETQLEKPEGYRIGKMGGRYLVTQVNGSWADWSATWNGAVRLARKHISEQE